MNILVVGCGSIGSRRAKILSQLGMKLTLVDSDLEQAGKLAQVVGTHRTFLTIKDATENTRYDAAFICSPPEYHWSHGMQCASQGIHLFIEKPIGIDVDMVKHLVHEVQRQAVIGIMGQSWRFLPSLRFFAKELDGFGTIYANMTSGQDLDDWIAGKRGVDTPYASQGVVKVSLAHALDTAQWLFEPIQWVTALSSTTNRFGPGDDIVTVLLRMRSGAQVVIHNNFLSRPRRDSIEAMNAHGEWITWEPNPSEFPEMYELETVHFIECVKKKYQGQPDLAQGIANLEWMNAVELANESGTWQKIGEQWKTITGRK